MFLSCLANVIAYILLYIKFYFLRRQVFTNDQTNISTRNIDTHISRNDYSFPWLYKQVSSCPFNGGRRCWTLYDGTSHIIFSHHFDTTWTTCCYFKKSCGSGS